MLKTQFDLQSCLNSQPNQYLNSDDITLEGKYRTFEECKGSERTQTDGIPKKFENLKIILEYQNSHGTTFYSLYDHKQGENKNRHLIKKPKELIQ